MLKEDPKERQEQVDPILLDPNLKVEDAINFTKGGISIMTRLVESNILHLPMLKVSTFYFYKVPY